MSIAHNALTADRAEAIAELYEHHVSRFPPKPEASATWTAPATMGLAK